MSFELKNIKVLERQSNETHCYEATVHFKGKKIAEVGNAGHGGGDDLLVLDEALFAELERELAKLPETVPNDKYDWKTTKWPILSVRMRFEHMCCDQVNAWLARKEVARLTKKWTFIELTEDGRFANQIVQWPKKYTLDAVRKVADKDFPGWTCFNELSEDQQLAALSGKPVFSEAA